ncbi:Fe-S oxidoreductase [Methanobrevibacter sp. 87.7]|uniref:aldo/keto reductase n=1 Tax=Methanobrevibacter sp. 87.7 TaxID=387957 RepID=UPI000B510FCF|nr:aldo/keto reductase [Methanobrevibacter sp. 87.7]OWT32352.1 Fe-S oxidoreductase [Methanobrevibacter sp. 87.7]
MTANFGLGLMRLPIIGDNVENIDIDQLQEMVDTAMENNVNFFDTAYPYHNGESEKAIKKTLVDKYPRDSFILSNKLPLFDIEKEEDIEKIFNIQIQRCGVDYFDYYMLHNLSTWSKTIFKDADCFGFINKLKEEGKAKKIGFSFHDKPELLKSILDEHPELDFILLQINFVDWENESIEACECYEIALEYGLEILVMEPLKGGTIVNMPDSAKEILKNYHPEDSIAKWGLRFSGSLDNVSYVLSGVSNLEQLKDNINTFKDFKPITLNEVLLLNKATDIINDSVAIPCTGCGYCLKDGVCERHIPIAEYFNLYNQASLLGFKDFSKYLIDVYKEFEVTMYDF